MADIMLRCEGVCKSFADGVGKKVSILEDVNLNVSRGDLVSVCGKSGSGKSTLMHILSSLLKPDKGQVLFGGKDIYSMTEREMLLFRQRSVGFVFQDNLLLDDLSVEENVMLPIEIAGKDKQRLKKRALGLAEEMGISGILKSRTGVISSGEKSRVSLLRAIATDKDLVFLDEPTGALDNQSARGVENLVLSLSGELGIAFVYVTHDDVFARMAARGFIISDRHLHERNAL